MRNRFTLDLEKRTLVLGEKTLVVGVLNVTPDSFSDGGRYLDAGRAIERAFEMESAGADIVEIGGESSRPGAPPVGLQEEIDRIEPVLKAIVPGLSVPVSVDTYKSRVVEIALECGAALINDVSALRFDPSLAGVVARRNAGLILMHMRGTPADMQTLEPARDILSEIEADLSEAVSKAETRGVPRSRIILDPGIGFGKTLEQNLLILNQLQRLARLGLPIMIGTSRKSFIGRLTGKPAGERLFGTAASVTAAILRGAHLIRVHDVAEMVEVARITDAIAAQEPPSKATSV
jgi:dihydropteroate synthase